MWEADLVSVTASGYAIEYEIKTSAQDFRRDREKGRHEILLRTHRSSHMQGIRDTWRGNGPSRFFYIFAPDVPTEDLSVPPYAGAATTARNENWMPPLSEAPRLHTQAVADDVREYLSRGLMHRYWDLRLSSRS